MKALRRILVVIMCIFYIPLIIILSTYSLLSLPIRWVLFGDLKANNIESILYKYLEFITNTK